MLIATRDPPTINGSRFFRLKHRHENWIIMLLEGGPLWIPDVEGRWKLTASYDGWIVEGSGLDGCQDSVPEAIHVKVYDGLGLLLTNAGTLEPVSAEEEQSYHFQQMLIDVFG